MGLKRKINQYIDAGFPVLYINSFEDDKLDVMLKELGEGKDIVEWNAAMLIPNRSMSFFHTLLRLCTYAVGLELSLIHI